MRYICLLTLLWLFALPLTPANALDLLQQHLDARLPAGARWALQVTDDATDTTTVHGEAEAPLVPGSLVKLLVTGAVLDAGPEFWPPTVLLGAPPVDGTLNGPLVLRGAGQALLSTEVLRSAVRALRESGLRRIDGDIVADTSFLATEGGERNRTGSAYAPPGALGLDLHTVRVTVLPSNPGEPPQARIEPPHSAARFAVAARTVAEGSNSVRIERLDDLSYKVGGNLPQHDGAVVQRFALQEPALYAAGTLKTLLAEAGIDVTGTARSGRAPAGALVLAQLPGPGLDATLSAMNRHSLNVVADNLLLALGARHSGPPGTRAKGVAAVADFLTGLGVARAGVRLTDGSGLSAANRVTTDFVTRYLVAVARQPWFERFRATLPRPGEEGTLRGLPLADADFRLKSGRLADVYALAGYRADAAGKQHAFCFIVNSPGIGVLPQADAIGAEVLRFVAVGTPP